MTQLLTKFRSFILKFIPPPGPRRKKLIIILAILAIITILRETNVIEMNWYSSDISGHHTANFNCYNSVIPIGPNEDEIVRSASDYKIMVYHRGKEIYSEGTGYPVLIDLDRLPDGLSLWMPFWKKFNFSTMVFFGKPLQIGTGNDSTIISSSCSGSMVFEERISVRGMCAHRKAVETIEQHVAMLVATEVRNHLQTHFVHQ